jgi:hypothetical protein
VGSPLSFPWIDDDQWSPLLSMMPSCSRPSRTLRAAKTRCPSGILDRRSARRLWNAQVGTAGWPSRSNNRMVVWFRLPPGGLRGLSGPRGSDRPAVIRGITTFVGPILSPLGPKCLSQLIAMEREDLSRRSSISSKTASAASGDQKREISTEAGRRCAGRCSGSLTIYRPGAGGPAVRCARGLPCAGRNRPRSR